jgi:ketosteroid isomerase-like protein
MSRNDVELVRRLYLDGGPFSLPLSADDERALLDRHFRDFYDDQVEVRMPPDYPEGEQLLVGRRGMAEVISQMRDSWTTWRFVPERFIETGNHVTVFIRVVAQGSASGLPSERETAHVWAVRNGRLTAIQVYRDRDQALDAMGVSDDSEAAGDS